MSRYIEILALLYTQQGRVAPELLYIGSHARECQRYVTEDGWDLSGKECNCTVYLHAIPAETEKQFDENTLKGVVIEEAGGVGWRLLHSKRWRGAGSAYASPQLTPDCRCWPDQMRAFWCETGHLTECHHPLTCRQAGCSHLERYADDDPREERSL